MLRRNDGDGIAPMKHAAIGSVLFTVGVMSGAPSVAQDDTVWGVMAYDDVCPVVLSTAPIASGIGTVEVQAAACLGGLDGLRGWSTTNDGNSVIFYAGPNLDAVARVDAEGDGQFVGFYGDGVPITMMQLGGVAPSAEPGADMRLQSVYRVEAYGMSCRVTFDAVNLENGLQSVGFVDAQCPGVLDRMAGWVLSPMWELQLFDGLGEPMLYADSTEDGRFIGTLVSDGTQVVITPE